MSLLSKSKKGLLMLLSKLVSFRVIAIMSVIAFYLVVTDQHLTLAAIILGFLALERLMVQIFVNSIFNKLVDPRQTNVEETEESEESESLIPIKFFGGPLNGIEQKVATLKPHLFHPHVNKDEEGRSIAAYTKSPTGEDIVVFDAVYGKYDLVGDTGSYFFDRDLDQEEVVEEMKKMMDEEERNG